MSLPRSQVCESVAEKISGALGKIPSLHAFVGLDGFVDEIVDVVDQRHEPTRYDRVQTIQRLGEKILAAAGQSCNYELVVKQSKIGGNGPIMAGAMAALGAGVTCLGALGYPEIHPVFIELAARARVIGIAAPGQTQALEFEDGKVMLNKLSSFLDISWETLAGRAPEAVLKMALADAALVAMNNWTMIPRMGEIWQKLAQILANLPGPRRRFFVDLADPEKRTRRDLAAALETLRNIQTSADVILGLNWKEAIAVAEASGAGKFAAESAALPAAEAIRGKLDLSCVVVHPRGHAVAATRDEAAQFAGPFVHQPAISTGAGDHFNAGFCIGRMLELSLEESLCAGVACSGYYVRHGKSPAGRELAEFAARLPEPEK